MQLSHVWDHTLGLPAAQLGKAARNSTRTPKLDDNFLNKAVCKAFISLL